MSESTKPAKEKKQAYYAEVAEVPQREVSRQNRTNKETGQVKEVIFRHPYTKDDLISFTFEPRKRYQPAKDGTTTEVEPLCPLESATRIPTLSEYADPLDGVEAILECVLPSIMSYYEGEKARLAAIPPEKRKKVTRTPKEKVDIGAIKAAAVKEALSKLTLDLPSLLAEQKTLFERGDLVGGMAITAKIQQALLGTVAV